MTKRIKEKAKKKYRNNDRKPFELSLKLKLGVFSPIQIAHRPNPFSLISALHSASEVMIGF